MRASSYGGGTSSSGKVQLKLEGLTPEQVAGQHILLVEDIIDTGHTITTLTAHMEALGAASVATATLLNKLERRVVPFTPQYQGFRVMPGRAPIPAATTPLACSSYLLLLAARRP